MLGAAFKEENQIKEGVERSWHHNTQILTSDILKSKRINRIDYKNLSLFPSRIFTEMIESPKHCSI